MVRILVLWQRDALVWMWGVSFSARFRENTPY